MPYFFELLLFYKLRYWKYSFQRRPMSFLTGKIAAAALLALLSFQLILGCMLSSREVHLLHQVSIPKLLLAGLLIDLSGLFYFPAPCHRDIRKGVYFLYPVSAAVLNNMRMLESACSIFSLISCNLIVLPVFALDGGHGFPLLLVLVTLLQLLSFMIYDLVMLIFGKVYLLTLCMFLLLMGIFLAAKKAAAIGAVLHAAEALGMAGCLALGVLAAAILYFADRAIFFTTTIKKMPHG